MGIRTIEAIAANICDVAVRLHRETPGYANYSNAGAIQHPLTYPELEPRRVPAVGASLCQSA